ncbi:O-antigen ligase family protein [Streptococcus suis]
MNNIKKNSIGSTVLLFFILYNSISFINMRLFVMYDKIAFYVNLLMLILLFIFQNKIYKHEQENFLFLVIFSSYGLFSLLFTGGGIGSVVTPIYSILLIILLSRSSFSKNMIKLLVITLLIVNMILVYNSPGYYVKALYDKSSYLNSNTVGMVIMYTAIYLKIFIKKLRIKNSSIITTLLLVFSMWGIINTESRGSLLTLIAFILLDIIVPKKFWLNKKRTIFITITIIGLGVLIPFIFVHLYHSGFKFILPFTSKSLYTGREVIWGNFYSYMDSSVISWMFGLGSQITLWDAGSISLHNNYLAVISNFGIIGFTMYYGYLISLISSLYNKKRLTNYQISLLIGFICVLLNGFVEITTLWHIMFYFNFMFLGFAINEMETIAVNIEN